MKHQSAQLTVHFKVPISGTQCMHFFIIIATYDVYHMYQHQGTHYFCIPQYILVRKMISWQLKK